METPLDPDAIRLVEKALAELKRRGVTKDYCPRCDTFDWTVEPVAVELIPLKGSSSLPHSYFPAHASLLQITCKNCGYTMFHNLKIIGL